MDTFDRDLNPVQHLVADAIGEPGKRTFFLQARSGRELISLVLEKHEVANLAISILQLLEELQEKYPQLAAGDSMPAVLYPEQPVEPDFRVGQLIVGYSEEEDRIWLIAKALIIDDSGAVVDPEEGNVPTVRFVATREQVRAMSDHALEVVQRGRPVCPLCGRAIDIDGHFCPRTDGHAMPIVL